MTTPNRPQRTQTLATVLGLLEGAKKQAHQTASLLYRQVQRTELFTGHRRTYSPLTEDQDATIVADVVPVDAKKVQLDAESLLVQVAGTWTRFYDLQHTMDAADQSASADVIVDGNVIMENVPITTLLFLEKRLDDLHTFVSKLPVHDPSKDWMASDAPGIFQSEPQVTATTKKTTTYVIVVQATDKHPAQIKDRTEDVPVGKWTRVEFSGGVTARRYAELLGRVDKLRAAVKIARETANRVDAPDRTGAERLFQYVLEGTV